MEQFVDLESLSDGDREKIFNGWEKSWMEEANYPSAQVTHVSHHPIVAEFARHKEAVPYMLDRIREDITWTFPLWKYLESELDDSALDELRESIDQDLRAEPTENPLWNKLYFLEGKRMAIIAHFDKLNKT